MDSRIRDQVYALIERIAPRARDALSEDARLVCDLGLESIQLVELAFDVETAFSIRIEEKELCAIKTVDDLVRAIALHLEREPRVVVHDG